MKKYILDTDICIYWLKGNDNIEKSIINHGLNNIFITIITECELFYGAHKSVKKEKNLAVIKELKTKIGTLQIDNGAPNIYGKIKTYLEAQGQIVDDADLLIASIALANNATLVTNNVEHFRRIDELKLENWK